MQVSIKVGQVGCQRNLQSCDSLLLFSFFSMHFDDGLEAGDFKHPIADRVFVNEFKK